MDILITDLTEPDNFLYFITLFSLALGGAHYLYFSFHHSWIILGNVFMFLLCATRISTEFAIHLLDDYQMAYQVATVHGLVVVVNAYLLWLCTYAYIRPLRGWQFEERFHTVLGTIFFILFLSHLYPNATRVMYTILPNKVDGRWVYTTDMNSGWLQYTFTITAIFQLIIIGLFIFDILKTRRNVVFKTILLISYLVMPLLAANYLYSTYAGQNYQVANVGYIFLAHSIIVSWFCSDYRLFQNGFDRATQDILNSIADITIYTNLNFQVQFINEAGIQTLGEHSLNIIINRLLATHGDTSITTIDTAIHHLLQNQTDDFELTLKTPKGKIHTILQAKPFLRDQQQIGYIFLLTNVSELRHNQAQLEQANRTKDQLFAIIGHDLRKPTIAFRGISSKINHLLKRNDFQRLQKLGHHWEAAANALNHLVDNLLNWAMQQRDILPYDPQKINLAPAVSDSIEPLKNMIADKNIDLLIQIPENTQVLADFNALLTIMRNIIDNAIKFTPENGRIEVQAAANAGQIKVSVSDTGIGMNEQQMQELFEIKKGKSRRGTAGEKGTGIGLSLVKELVKVNQGELKIESKTNAGTTINILLPRAA